MNDSDHGLMRRIAAGDPWAFECLVERWGPRVRCVLRRMAGESPLDDLAQEVFLRVLTSSRRYRPSHAFSTWLYRVVHSVHCDYRRRTSRWRRESDGIRMQQESVTPHETARKMEVAQFVDVAIARLPPALRTIVVLKHFAHLTFVEIADVLEEPLSTVKSRAQAALRTMNVELIKMGLHPAELEA